MEALEGAVSPSPHALLEAVLQQGLEKHVLELEILGYTVLPPLALAAAQALRRRILDLAEQERREGKAYLDQTGQRIWKLLVRGPLFERMVLEPRVLTLMTYLLGERFVVSSLSANIIRSGARAQPLHTDSALLPEPLPVLSQVATAIWCCEDFIPENAGTLVVPGSHRACRRPRETESLRARALQCPQGSILVLHGNLWHSSGPKQTEGERVGIIACFARMHLKLQEKYTGSEARRLGRRNPVLARLLGREVPLGWDRQGPDMKLMHQAMQDTKTP